MGAAARIPLLWPGSWRGAEALALLDGTPINCLTTATDLPPEVERAAKEKGISCERFAWKDWGEIDWSASRTIAIGNGFWPGSSGGQNRQEGGPTGAPWVDANGWIIQLARARMPASAEILLHSPPPDDPLALSAAGYVLALMEAWSYGARRPVWLAPQHAAEAIQGAGEGAAIWRLIRDLLLWQQNRQAWRQYEPVSSLLVVSDFSGPNQFMAGEVLNLAARQHIAFTPVETSRLTAISFKGKRAALYVDAQPPPKAALERLRAFTAGGGLLLAQARTAALFTGGGKGDPSHPRFTIQQFGKGRVAVSKQDYEDPWILARDAHLLMSRRWDAIRLFNAGSMLAHYTASPGGASSVVHVLNYNCRPSGNLVSLQIPVSARRAVLHTPGAGSTPAPIVRRDGRAEIDLRAFPAYCAIELQLV